MTDEFEERLFTLAERHFPSLDALRAFFAAQITRTDSMAEKLELRAAAQAATDRHFARVAAEADAPVPTPPAPSRPPTPLPPDASEDEKFARRYGPTHPLRAKPGNKNVSEDRAPTSTPEPRPQSLDSIAKHFGRMIKQAGDDEGKVRALEIEEEQAKADFHQAIERERVEALAAAAAEDEAFQQKWGAPPIGLSFGAGSPKPKVRKSDRGGRNDEGESQGVAEAAAIPEQEVRSDAEGATRRARGHSSKGVTET